MIERVLPLLDSSTPSSTSFSSSLSSTDAEVFRRRGAIEAILAVLGEDIPVASKER